MENRLKELESLLKEIEIMKETIKEYDSKINSNHSKILDKTGESIAQAILALKSSTTSAPPIDNLSPNSAFKFTPAKQIEIYEDRYNALSSKYLTVI